MEFWIDATPPNITLEDDDEDWILGLLPIKNSGCYHAPDENNNVTIDVSDPESFISIDGSKLIIKDKAVQDSFVIHFSEMEFLGQNQNGFKLQKNLNFSNILVNLGWTEGNSSISNDFLFKVITLNKLGIETKIEQEFSFDLILPKIRLADDEIWNQIIQDSVAFDNDNDGKVNEDPIDGINNDGDWDDVNGNGRRDYYFNEWCEYAYDYKGEVTDSICHKEAVLEQEFIDEDPVDFIYCGYSEFSISYLQDNLSLKFQEKEKTNKLFYKNIWSACSGIDYSSYRLYMNGEITDISLIENLQLIINEKKYGMHRFRPIISDHSGNFNSFIFRLSIIFPYSDKKLESLRICFINFQK